jgi:type VI secretion system secreted protein Hcp
MALDMFLELDGVEGESKDTEFAGKIDILSFSVGASNVGAGHYGGGSGASKGQMRDISIGKRVDQSSATLYGFCFLGKHIAKGALHVRKAAGESPLEYLKYEMDEVFITNISTSDNAAGGIANESVSLNFSKIKMTYQMQKDTGEKAPAKEVTIDLKENKVEQG